MTRTITYAQLKARGACPTQLHLFRRLFGKAVIVTEATAVEHAQAFNWTWAASRLLSLSAQQAYSEATDTAWRVYFEAAAPAWRAYDEAIDTPWRAYDEAVVTAQRAYDEATAPVRRAYDEAIVTARRAYDKVKATAFARAYNDDAEGL